MGGAPTQSHAQLGFGWLGRAPPGAAGRPYCTRNSTSKLVLYALRLHVNVCQYAARLEAGEAPGKRAEAAAALPPW